MANNSDRSDDDPTDTQQSDSERDTQLPGAERKPKRMSHYGYVHLAARWPRSTDIQVAAAGPSSPDPPAHRLPPPLRPLRGRNLPLRSQIPRPV